VVYPPPNLGIEEVSRSYDLFGKITTEGSLGILFSTFTIAFVFISSTSKTDIEVPHAIDNKMSVAYK
jgi:hypothetical protein